MVDLPNTDVEPEPFTQSVEPGEAASAEPVVAEPAVEPEPEAPPVEPDWIYQEPEPPQETPPQAPAQPPAYPSQPQPQPYPVPPVGNAEAELNALVKDPEGWKRQIQQETLQQVGQHFGYQQQQMAGELNHMRQTYAAGEISKGKANVKKAYDHLNKNKSFRSNKVIQNQVKTTLEGYLNEASKAARYGDYGPINEFSRIGPEQLDGMMAYYGSLSGAPSPGVGPLQVEGATVESSRPAAAGESVVLTPLQEDIARRMGPGYREQMIKGVLEGQKHDDFEVNR